MKGTTTEEEEGGRARERARMEQAEVQDVDMANDNGAATVLFLHLSLSHHRFILSNFFSILGDLSWNSRSDWKLMQDVEDMKKRLKEMEDEAAALREMQAKVEKEMGAVQGSFHVSVFAFLLLGDAGVVFLCPNCMMQISL